MFELQSATEQLTLVKDGPAVVAHFYPQTRTLCFIEVVSESDRAQIVEHLGGANKISEPPPAVDNELLQAIKRAVTKRPASR